MEESDTICYIKRSIRKILIQRDHEKEREGDERSISIQIGGEEGEVIHISREEFLSLRELMEYITFV